MDFTNSELQTLRYLLNEEMRQIHNKEWHVAKPLLQHLFEISAKLEQTQKTLDENETLLIDDESFILTPQQGN